MRVWAEDAGYGQDINLYFLDGGRPERLLTIQEADGLGYHVWESTPVIEGAVPETPTLRLPRSWIKPLVEALTKAMPAVLEGEAFTLLKDTLAKEQARVDQLIKHVTKDSYA